MRNKILFVFSNREAKVRKDILTILREYSDSNKHLDINLVITQHADHLKELVASFAQYNEDKGIIFVAGGDGSINEASNTLVDLRSKSALGVLPFGTANDFCKLHYKNFSFTSFLNDLPNLKIAPIDLLYLEGKLQLLGDGPNNIKEKKLRYIDYTYAVNVASIGLDTEILKSAFMFLHRLPWLKSSAYTLAVLKHFFALRTREHTYTIGNKELNLNSLLAAFCNGGFYGNGFAPAPNCDLQDGLLNYCIAPEFNHLQFAKLAIPYKNGLIEEHKDKVYLDLTDNIIIKAQDGEPFIGNFDGSIFSTDHLSITVKPKLLPFAFVGDYSQRLITDPRSIL